jgi:hypothetical protein
VVREEFASLFVSTKLQPFHPLFRFRQPFYQIAAVRLAVAAEFSQRGCPVRSLTDGGGQLFLVCLQGLSQCFGEVFRESLYIERHWN